MKRVRGYAEWSPKPVNLKRVTDAINVLDEYRYQLPLTVRQIYYRMVSKDQIDKTDKGYKNLAEALNRARRAGRIPMDYIRDDGIKESDPDGYGSFETLENCINQALKEGDLNRDVGQPFHQIVLCEAAGMLPMLAAVADDFGVKVLSSGGFDSLTAQHSLAKAIEDDGRPAKLWHLGDHDPSGEAVHVALFENVMSFCGDLREIDTNRLAVTPAQIRRYNLPGKPPKKTDARAFTSEVTVQCEAIPPDVLQDILRDALSKEYDKSIYNAERATFEAKRSSYLQDRDHE